MNDTHYLQPDWGHLVGRFVQIKLGDHLVRSGRVEAVTADDGILWISAGGAEPRALYERTHGYSVWMEDPPMMKL